MEGFEDIAPYLGYFEENTTNKEILPGDDLDAIEIQPDDDPDAIDAFVDSLLLDDHGHLQVHSFNSVDGGDHGSTGNIKLLGMENIHHVPLNPRSTSLSMEETSNKEILPEDDPDAIDAFVDSLLLDVPDHLQVHSFNSVDGGDHGSNGNIKLLGMENTHHVPMNPTSMEELTDKHLADFEDFMQAKKLDDRDQPSLTGSIIPDDHEPPKILKGESSKTAGTPSVFQRASNNTLKSKKLDKAKIIPPRFKIYALDIGPLKVQANKLISMSGSIQFGWQNLLWEITKRGEPTIRIKFKWANISAMRVFKHGRAHSGLALKLNASPEFYLESGITDVKTRRTKWNTMMDFTNGEAKRHWHILICSSREAKKVIRLLTADPRFPRLIRMEYFYPSINTGPYNELGNGETQQQQQANLNPSINIGPYNELGNREAQQQQQAMKNHLSILEASNSLSQLRVQTNYNQHYHIPNPGTMMLSSQSSGENYQRPHEDHNIRYNIADLGLGPIADFHPTGWMD